MAWPGVIEAYRAFLPVAPSTPIITLNEGNTPLVESRQVGPPLRVSLSFKLESLNPTGSFKDRGMTVAVSKALEAKARAVICASTGNTAASAAAYAARAGLPSIIVLPTAAVAAGKMGQVLAHGAVPIVVAGGFDAALAATRDAADVLGLALVNSLNPHRLEGQKTAAFEICDHLKRSPDVIVVPVGNAGNVTAYGRGFAEYRARGLCPRVPRLIGIQAAGAAPLVDGSPVREPTTIASAIRIGNPASWSIAVESVRTSSGRFMKVTDEEIKRAQRDLAIEEGILVEPASAAAVAGLRRLCQEEGLTGQTVVCVLTGHGLKDPSQLPGTGEALPEPISASPEILIKTVERLLRALD